MISRRNIRVKVMQTLYTAVTSESESDSARWNLPAMQKVLQAHFSQTQELLVYLIFFLTEVCRYAETDSHQRASKHLPTYEDLHVSTKIAGNKIIGRLLEDRSFQEILQSIKPQHRSDPELIKKIYLLLTDSPEYKKYIHIPERDNREEKEILEFIVDKLMLANELFTSHAEELFSNWDDDGELVVLLLMNCIQKPTSVNFLELISPDKKEFAEKLLTTVDEKKEYLESLIIPKLKNWDPERIALLDMILMKMGVSEFLYFETIPPKVTINEYIDLAKEYSTPQSGQFVNGILDNIHKELVQQGKMKKVDFKKT